MTRPRVGIVADYLEEAWPSMDLVADKLLAGLAASSTIDAVLLRPSLRWRVARLPGLRRMPPAPMIDRMLNRHFDYPRWLRGHVDGLQLFHIVDHTYAHLVSSLPAARTVVTCHDLDAFRSLLTPEAEPRTRLFRALASRTLAGLRAAARVICDTQAIADALIARQIRDAGSVRVVPLGVDDAFTTAADAEGDDRAAALLGAADRRGAPELLHVGSTAPRKRIDLVLRILARVAAECPDVRLVRVGGLTAEQRELARDLGVAGRVRELAFVDTRTLAAIYRRASAVVLPSDREGFGLPVIEALRCGTPVVASDLPPLREVGGAAVTYCPPGEPDAFAAALVPIVSGARPVDGASLARAAAGFTWSAHAAAVERIYRELV